MTNEFASEATMTITPAQATVIRQALHALSSLIEGEVDGKRRLFWSGFEMDADEGEEVPGALTTEAGYKVLLRDTFDKVAAIEATWTHETPRTL